ncbi:GerMN domain-containing protein [Streptomyces sp. NPDC058301]|uniref:GerMN domain-containing protein n=1 Tax=Streptomyces sp. NPDC058301 TaxID=3346436 RepID=UPI0036E47A71
MRGARAVALLLPALFLATGCGVQGSGVVEVGDPATVHLAPDYADGTALYFQGPGGLVPVVRSVKTAGQQGAAILLLLNGPTEAEKDVGLTTQLPNYYGGLGMSTEGDEVRIRLERPVRDLTALAQQQLVCTAAHATTREGASAVKVTVDGPDTRLAPQSCPF